MIRFLQSLLLAIAMGHCAVLDVLSRDYFLAGICTVLCLFNLLMGTVSCSVRAP